MATPAQAAADFLDLNDTEVRQFNGACTSMVAIITQTGAPVNVANLAATVDGFTDSEKNDFINEIASQGDGKGSHFPCKKPAS